MYAPTLALCLIGTAIPYTIPWVLCGLTESGRPLTLEGALTSRGSAKRTVSSATECC